MGIQRTQSGHRRVIQGREHTVRNKKNFAWEVVAESRQSTEDWSGKEKHDIQGRRNVSRQKAHGPVEPRDMASESWVWPKEALGHDWQWPRPEGSRIKDMREHGLEGVRRCA